MAETLLLPCCARSGCFFSHSVCDELVCSICSFLPCRSVIRLTEAAQRISILRSFLTAIRFDFRERPGVYLVGLAQRYSIFPSLKSLHLYWPDLTQRTTTEAGIYDAVYESLRYLPQSCEEVYLTLQSSEAALLRVLLNALEEMMIELESEGLVLDVLDIKVYSGIQFRCNRGMVTTLASTRILRLNRDKILSLSSFIRKVRLSIHKSFITT